MFKKIFTISLSAVLMGQSLYVLPIEAIPQESFDEKKTDTSSIDPRIVTALLNNKDFLEAVQERMSPSSDKYVPKVLRKMQKEKHTVKLISDRLIDSWYKFDAEGNYSGREQALRYLTKEFKPITNLKLQGEINKAIKFKKIGSLPLSYEKKLKEAGVYKIVNFYATRALEEEQLTVWERARKYIKENPLEVKIWVVGLFVYGFVEALPALTRLLHNGLTYTWDSCKGWWNDQNEGKKDTFIAYDACLEGLPFRLSNTANNYDGLEELDKYYRLLSHKDLEQVTNFQEIGEFSNGETNFKLRWRCLREKFLFNESKRITNKEIRKIFPRMKYAAEYKVIRNTFINLKIPLDLLEMKKLPSENSESYEEIEKQLKELQGTKHQQLIDKIYALNIDNESDKVIYDSFGEEALDKLDLDKKSTKKKAFKVKKQEFLKQQVFYNLGEFLTNFSIGALSHILSSLLVQFPPIKKLATKSVPPLATAVVYEGINFVSEKTKEKKLLQKPTPDVQLSRENNSTENQNIPSLEIAHIYQSPDFKLTPPHAKLFKESNWFRKGVAASFLPTHHYPNLKNLLLSFGPFLIIDQIKTHVLDNHKRKQQQENNKYFDRLFSDISYH